MTLFWSSFQPWENNKVVKTNICVYGKWYSLKQKNIIYLLKSTNSPQFLMKNETKQNKNRNKENKVGKQPKKNPVFKITLLNSWLLFPTNNHWGARKIAEPSHKLHCVCSQQCCFLLSLLNQNVDVAWITDSIYAGKSLTLSFMFSFLRHIKSTRIQQMFLIPTSEGRHLIISATVLVMPKLLLIWWQINMNIFPFVW